MTPVLNANSVSFRVGRKWLLDDVSLTIFPGESIAVVGPNGAGKSTLLRVLAGELAPHAGVVLLNRRKLSNISPRELALRRAVLSQDVSLAFPFTVAEVVGMGAGDIRGPAIDTMIDDALAEVDLSGFRQRLITTLSGGERQRVHFARVLLQIACGETVRGPGLLLLDEPTASLDLRHQLDVVAAAKRRVERGTAVVAVLHDLNLASLFAKRIIVLEGGRVAAAGSPRETITNELLERIFEVSAKMSLDESVPFLLPQMLRRTTTLPKQ